MTDHQKRWAQGLAAAAAAGALVAAGLLTAPAATANPERIAEVEAFLTNLEMEAAAAHGRFEDAEYELSQLNGKIDQTQTKVNRAKDDLKETQGSIGRYAAAAYRTGGIDSSLQLLLADDPQDFLDQAVILDIVASGQNAALRKSQVARLKLAQASAELSQQQTQAEDVVSIMRERQEEFDAKVAETQSYLGQLKEEERQRLEEERKRRAEADRAAAAAALAAAQAAAAQAAANQSNSSGSSGSSSSSGSSGSSSSSGSSGSSGNSANGGPNDGGSWSSGNGGSTAGSGKAAIAVAYALAQVGKPYSYAAQPPNSWDCTKLTAAAWAQAGVRLTAYSYVQAREVRQIPASDLQPGDLLFFFKNGSHHASMYIGGGQIVEASSPRSGVRITSVWNPWNTANFSWAGRPYS